MANSDKNIVITPNVGNTADPKIVFSGANSTTSAANITVQIYPDNNGSLSFEGSAGQLFSITNDLSNTLFTVNDVSGIPSIEVFANGLITVAKYGGVLEVGGVSGMKVPVGSTAQRPTATQGYIRYNTTANTFEGYDGSQWGSIGGGSAINSATQYAILFANTANTIGWTAQGVAGQLLQANGASAPVWSSNITVTNAVANSVASNTVTANSVISKTVVEKTSAPTISTNTLTLDLTQSGVFEVLLNANITTLTIQNTPASGNVVRFVLLFTADGTARSVTWPASFRWAGGQPPTITSTLNKKDAFTFFTTDGGTSWNGFISGQGI